MEYGQTELKVLSSANADSQNFVRAVVEQSDSGLTLRYLDVVANRRPPRWLSARWEYDNLTFVAEESPGPILSEALLNHEGGRLRLGGRDVALPAIQQQVAFQREPSLTYRDTSPLPWPVNVYKIHRQGNVPPDRSSGLLVGTDCPSFPRFETAFRAFFYEGALTNGTGSLPTEAGRFRIVQIQAWIRRVTIAPTHLDIWVAGDEATGARVEINGSTWQTDKRVGKTGKVRLRLPSGLPDDAWLYLSRDGRWLDYRPLGQSLLGVADLTRSGVQVEIPEDARTQIEALLTRGEGPHIEYKSTLPGGSREDKRKVLKTVAAFAALLNGVGTRQRRGTIPAHSLAPTRRLFDALTGPFAGELNSTEDRYLGAARVHSPLKAEDPHSPTAAAAVSSSE